MWISNKINRRNHKVVLCHSRRAFAEIASKDQAKLQVVLWAAESTRSLRFNKIIFAGEFEDLFGAVLRPQAWPAFLFQRDEIISSLFGIEELQVLVVRSETNRGAFFIADSVIHTIGMGWFSRTLRQDSVLVI